MHWTQCRFEEDEQHELLRSWLSLVPHVSKQGLFSLRMVGDRQSVTPLPAWIDFSLV